MNNYSIEIYGIADYGSFTIVLVQIMCWFRSYPIISSMYQNVHLNCIQTKLFLWILEALMVHGKEVRISLLFLLCPNKR